MSDSIPTTLGFFRHYAPHQEELITSLSESHPSEPRFVDLAEDNEWVIFYSSVWGKDLATFDDHEATVNRGPNKIDDSLFLPDVVPDTCHVMLKPNGLDDCWRFTCEKIFIRPEYKEAEEFLLSTCAAKSVIKAVVVTGRPGIGSSHFHFAITASS